MHFGRAVVPRFVGSNRIELGFCMKRAQVKVAKRVRNENVFVFGFGRVVLGLELGSARPTWLSVASIVLGLVSTRVGER